MKTKKNKILLISVLASCIISIQLANSQILGTTNSTFTVNNDDIGPYGEVKLLSGADYTDWNIRSALGNLIFFSSKNLGLKQRMTITDAGKVGIGTKTPLEKLHLRGGTLYVEGINQGLIVDAPGFKRVGLMKFKNRTAGIWRTSNQNFEFGRVSSADDVSNPAGATVDMTISETGKVRVWNDLIVSGKSSFNGGAAFLGEREIVVENPLSFNYRKDVTSNGGTGVSLRVLENPSAGAPIFQIRSSGNASRFFVEHDGYTGGQNSAYFSGKYNLPHIFGNKMVIGDLDDDEMDNSQYFNDYTLWVHGGIVGSDFAFSEPADWEDRVFDENYSLPTLTEIEEFIKQNKHLHTMPSEVEITQKGYTAHDMNKRIVKTIEELTLHTINQEKQIDNQKEIIENLMTRLSELETIVQK